MPGDQLAAVAETLAMPRSTYEEQRTRLSRPEPKAAPRARVRVSFEANGGGHGAESVTADIRSDVGEPLSWRELAASGMSTLVVASKKAVRMILGVEGFAPARLPRTRGALGKATYRGEIVRRPANPPLRRCV